MKTSLDIFSMYHFVFVHKRTQRKPRQNKTRHLIFCQWMVMHPASKCLATWAIAGYCSWFANHHASAQSARLIVGVDRYNLSSCCSTSRWDAAVVMTASVSLAISSLSTYTCTGVVRLLNNSNNLESDVEFDSTSESSDNVLAGLCHSWATCLHWY